MSLLNLFIVNKLFCKIIINKITQQIKIKNMNLLLMFCLAMAVMIKSKIEKHYSSIKKEKLFKCIEAGKFYDAYF